MPRGDRTGPWGMGPRSGRAAGYCSGYGMPGFANPVPGGRYGGGFGRGRGFWGRGGGFGRGFRFWNTGYADGWFSGAAPGFSAAQTDPEAEELSLKAQADYLQKELETIQKRLGEIENDPGKAAGKTK